MVSYHYQITMMKTLFRHYKNLYYLRHLECTHTESGEEQVIYQSLYGDMKMWARPKAMFYEKIKCTKDRFQETSDIMFYEKWECTKDRFEKIFDMTDEMANSLLLACRAHTGQVRKFSGVPYINHPIEVATLIHQFHPDETEAIEAAFLHDTLEDTTLDRSEIVNHRVLSIVLEVTDDKTLPKRRQKELQIINAPKKTREAKLVKLADKLHNCTSFVNEWKSGQISTEQLHAILCFSRVVVDGLAGASLPLEYKLKQLFEMLPSDIDADVYVEKYLSR